MALRGMLSCCALVSCAKVTPPAALISLIPSVPSLPVPDRMTPIARWPWSFASDARNSSTGCGMPGPWGGVDRQAAPINAHRFARRNDIDVIGLDRYFTADFANGHGGGA